MAPDTRQRILDAGSALFRHQGYGVGLKQILAQAGAPFGSMYHHFPGGKAQLAEEVIRGSAGYYAELALRCYDPTAELADNVRAMFAGAAEALAASDYADACPIATIALEVASVDEQLRRATHDVFEEWLAQLQVIIGAAGIAEPAARSLAVQFLISLEGAFVLCRAARDTETLHVAGEAVAASVAAALAAADG